MCGNLRWLTDLNATRNLFSESTMTETENLSTNYTDEDLTFFALVYKDYDATAACLKDLRKHYPSSRVILRSDGDEDPRFPLLARGHRVDFHGELRLFGIENGGAVIERMLELFLERPTRYLFKIDPDTVIHRRFKYLPDRSGVFGTMQCEEQSPSVQGGCMGISRDAADQIQQSRMLRDVRLKEPGKFINDSPYFFRMADRANRCGLASFDWIVPWVARELGIPLYRFDEVNCGWQQPPPNPEGLYAVSHPRGQL
jgi:hypothetical protein